MNSTIANAATSGNQADGQPEKPARNPSAVALGWTFAVILCAGAVFLSAQIEVWFIELVHNWWPFIPRMGYSTALGLAAFVLAVTVVGKSLGVIVAKLIGQKDS